MNFGSVEEFWPYYMSLHSKPVTRRLHFAGTFFGTMCLVYAVIFNWWFLLLGPLVAFGLAWCSHFFVEGNALESFVHPYWSLICDYKMFAYMFLGQMERELKRLGKKPVLQAY